MNSGGIRPQEPTAVKARVGSGLQLRGTGLVSVLQVWSDVPEAVTR